MKLKATLCKSLTAIAASVLVAACGDNAGQAQIDKCTTVAKAALQSPQDFKVVSSSTRETSEGMGVRLTIEYKGSSGAVETVEDRCWFAGSNFDKLTEFSVKAADGYRRVPPEKLDELKKTIEG